MIDNRILVRQPLQTGQISQQQNIRKNREQTEIQPSFKEVLNTQLKSEGVEFSKHARNRLVSRGIEVSESDLNKLEEGIMKAASKGARESLIMVNQVAYLVSVENRTVITAIDQESIKENVFTNIDSAVFM
ncbi:MAG TPA: flagellar protein [Halanaerobiaceae bacterium]|nr:flagellar protein [Halanaerobiaceae bacterium]HOA40587.1 TIGR02530 family flagellar biosynthesis protein [Halanaerobiales bacterium]HPZ63063.1 TIGR02530 family flagellar biosynthesis protein [Halanaerobiales bacterium]HQD04011.1 TIGR02530 family flagellar biosynthesis protein [Halanaerobiales bacterium]